LKEVKSTVDPAINLLSTIIEFVESKEPHVLEIDKMAPDFSVAATAAASLMQQIPGLIMKLIPLEREIKACTDQKEVKFAEAMKEFIKRVAEHLRRLGSIIKIVETEIEFFGDNDFIGTPPYPNVDSFARCWDSLKLEHEGKNRRAQRNAECYAFFLNVHHFLVSVQKTRIFIEAKKKKQLQQQRKKPAKEKEMNNKDVVDSMVNQYGRAAYSRLRRRRDRVTSKRNSKPPLHLSSEEIPDIIA